MESASLGSVQMNSDNLETALFHFYTNRPRIFKPEEAGREHSSVFKFAGVYFQSIGMH